MLKKRILSVLLCLCMVVGMLPTITPTAQAYNTGDDYPYHVGIDVYIVDDWNFYRCECTSFVAHCLTTRNGVDFHNRHVVYNGTYYALNDNTKWGDANHWAETARFVGIPIDMNPAVGAVAWKNKTSRFPTGHVAWVSSVKGDSVTIEEYNQAVLVDGVWKNDHKWHTRTVDKSEFDGYIHIKDINPYPIGSENIGNDFYAYIRSGLGSLNVTNAGTGSGYGNVQTARANAYDPRQIWHFIWDSGRNAYGIVNMYDGRYLDVLNGKNERFTNIGVCDNNGGDPQRWRLVYEPSGQRSTFNLVPYYTDSWVMDIENASAVPGTNIRIDQRWQNDAQRYTISKISDINTILTCNLGADFYARISYNGAYLQTLSTITESGRNMDVVTTRTLNSTDPKQIWHFIRQSNGSYKIKNAYSESDSWCLDVQNASAANGATIRMYFDDNGVAAQRWYLVNSLGESKYRIASALLYPGELYSIDLHNAEGAKAQLWQQNANLWQFFNISKVAYTNPGKPSAPTNIQVTATSSGTTITWDAVPPVNQYDVRQYQVYLDNDHQVFIPATTVNGTSYTSTVVLPDGEYYAAVRAINTNYPNCRSLYNWLDFSVAPTTHTVSVSAAPAG